VENLRMNQLEIFQLDKKSGENHNYYGTVADNLKVPVQRWFNK
jgi:hypothetical protein